MSSKKIELLAPSGTSETLYAAVRMGADAVYLGARKFSARKNAKNFTIEELKTAVEYCHVRGVKVYLTANTLIRDREMKEAIDLIETAVKIGLDAIIVQDLGFASLIRKLAPKLKIHGSTQMAVHTPAGAKKLESMGFSRVVLARELSKEEIREIKNSTNIELEVFIHGALCMSVSGQCYLSAVLGGRSGNRGLCAGPCRLPFKVKGSSGYDLSLKDLCLVDYIEELKQIGVTSLKIEGRMKRPEYVAAAVDVYREAIDEKAVSKQKLENLKAVFSRSGFTDGYYKGILTKDMFGIRTKEDVVSASDKVLKNLKGLYQKELPKVQLSIYAKVKINETALLTVEDEDKNQVTVIGKAVEKADKATLNLENLQKQLSKLGGTPFYCKKIDIDFDKDAYISTSELNALRREAIEKLSRIRCKVKETKLNSLNLDIKRRIETKGKPKIRARFPNAKDIPDCFKECELIYIPIDSKPEDIKGLINRGFNVAVEIPRIMFSRENTVKELLKQAKELGIKDVWAGNIAAIELSKEQKFNIHGGFSLNIFNSYSLDWVKNEGLIDTELSYELSLNQIATLGGTIKRGIIAYGRLPLMVMRNCPIKNVNNSCLNCKEPPSIRDRKNVEFKIQCKWGTSELLNSVVLYLGDKMDNLKGIDFVVLRFTVENSVETEKNFEIFHKQKEYPGPLTRGLYNKGVE